MTARHWHGYLWTGTGAELKNEALRTPGLPNSAETQAFLRNSMPPVRTGHYLLRRDATSRDLTWTDVDRVIEWMSANYERRPPMSGDVGFPTVNGHTPMAGDVGLEARRRISRDGLINGVDGGWGYYTSPSGGFFTIAAICCPHTHMPEIPCPLAPRT